MTSWFVEHKIVTGLLVLFAIGSVGSAFDKGDSTPVAAEQSTATPEKVSGDAASAQAARDARQAKADAAAKKAEAYAKSPAGIAEAAKEKAAEKAAAASDAKEAKAEAKAAKKQAAFDATTDGDWHLDSVNFENNSFGWMTARARMTYVGNDSSGDSGCFTLTLFQKGSDVASMTGCSSKALPGGTRTVQFISTDEVTGKFEYRFQKDF